jgi:hypothetical protein
MTTDTATPAVWTMEGPATKVAEQLWQEGSQLLPAEVLRIDDATAAIVVDVEGVDYILTMTRVPAQRVRPTQN